MKTLAEPEIPEHIENATILADQAGWQVERKSLSIALIPPDGSKHRRENISLTRPPSPPQLQKRLEIIGIASAARKAKDDPAPAEEKPKFICPECDRSFTAGAGLGSHRQKVHKVAGTTRNSPAAAPVKKATAKTPTVPAPRKEASQVKTPPALDGVEALVARFTQEIADHSAAQLKERDEQIVALKAQVEDLQAFKNAILGVTAATG